VLLNETYIFFLCKSFVFYCSKREKAFVSLMRLTFCKITCHVYSSSQFSFPC